MSDLTPNNNNNNTTSAGADHDSSASPSGASGAGAPSNTTSREGLRDRSWEVLQAKTFTKWVNSKLKDTCPPISDIVGTEMSNGVVLAKLLSAISPDTIRVNVNPKLRIHSTENVNKCLDYIRSKNLTLENIGATDIVDANPKLLLGLIWTIILRFTIEDLGIEGRTAREGLMVWCQRRVEKYGVKIDNFTSSWADGKAYAALVHSQNNNAFDYDEVARKQNALERTAFVFQEAEKQFSITRLLEPEDVCVLGGPEERSNMTYIAQFLSAFSEKAHVERAKRRINHFNNALKVLNDIKHDYELRAKNLIDLMASIADAWESTSFTGKYAQVAALRAEYRKYKTSTKRDIVGQKRDLVSLHNTIQTKAKSNRFNPYEAPDGLRLEDIDVKYNVFTAQEVKYIKQLKSKAREIKERLLAAFVAAAADFEAMLLHYNSAAAVRTGTLDEQKVAIDALLVEYTAKRDEKLVNLQALWEECVAANLEDNDATNNTFDDLQYEGLLTEELIQNTVKIIENQIVMAGVSNITQEQCDLYENTFRLFDKDQNNSLSMSEFKAALAGLEINVEEERIDAEFARVCNDNTVPPMNWQAAGHEVNLKQFVEYMCRLEEDSLSLQLILDAFAVIAKSKPYITLAEMQSCGFSPEQLQTLIGCMQPATDAPEPDAYIYTDLVTKAFDVSA